MQNKIKRIIGIVLSLIIVFSSLPFAMAANGDANDSPLEIGIKTNKESYSALEIAEFTVTITNVGDYKVENISTEVLFDKITPVGAKSEIVKEIESLESGENIELNFRAMLDTETANMGFLEKLIIKIIKFFIGTINAADNDFDDGRDLKEEKLVFRFGDNDVSGNVRVWYDTGLDSSDVDEVLAYYSDAVAKTNKITKTEKCLLNPKSQVTASSVLLSLFFSPSSKMLLQSRAAQKKATFPVLTTVL